MATRIFVCLALVCLLPCLMATAEAGCPEGYVNCFVNPCMFHECSEGEVCIPNYCGGCNAECHPARRR